MDRALRYGLPVVLTFAWLVTMLPCAFAKDITFRGKVIDYETREPIEGAVVVAFWDEGMATLAGESTRLKDVKETLTDKNGEWSITGPEGRPHDPNPIFSLVTGIHYTRHPQFIVFKPGYCSWPEGLYTEVCKDKIRSSGELMTDKTYELSKLNNKKDRLSVRVSPETGENEKGQKEFLKKQMEYLRLIDEESRYLGLDEYGYYRELKNEK